LTLARKSNNQESINVFKLTAFDLIFKNIKMFVALLMEKSINIQKKEEFKDITKRK
jgi:hypothetical protein